MDNPPPHQSPTRSYESAVGHEVVCARQPPFTTTRPGAAGGARLLVSIVAFAAAAMTVVFMVFRGPLRLHSDPPLEGVPSWSVWRAVLECRVLEFNRAFAQHFGLATTQGCQHDTADGLAVICGVLYPLIGFAKYIPNDRLHIARLYGIHGFC
jgi:hypothetical protein